MVKDHVVMNSINHHIYPKMSYTRVILQIYILYSCLGYTQRCHMIQQIYIFYHYLGYYCRKQRNSP